MYKKIGDYVYSPSWKVGSGAFSSVYRGIDTKTNMSVAIKIIKK
jgi:serine/threonine protein kinase